MNTNLIHTWLRDPQFASEVEAPEDAETEAAMFFPIEITGGPTVPMAEPSSPAPARPFTAQRIDITFCEAKRVQRDGTTGRSFSGSR